MAHTTGHSEQHATFTLDALHCPECADAVEQALRAQSHITSVHLDWAHNVVHVGYHAGMITSGELEQIIADTGCTCEPVDGAHDHADRGQPSERRRLQRLQHAVDVQPITMGTKHDRMQYELPATSADPAQRATKATPRPAADHSAHMGMNHPIPAGHPMAGKEAAEPVDHAAMGHDMAGMNHAAMAHDMAGMDHAAMSHDMSDPGMAAAMERDMRTKFFIALPLTILTVLYAPLGMNLFGVRLPSFGLDVNLIMLILSTPVVWYCGWMFIAGAYQSLKRGMLNMSVLIATGVLAAYLFSVLITFIGGESFFEAAAMLVTFVLFGHWMEMRSRRGTNEALRALFDLVPPQATVIRDGGEVTIPSSEVQVGDTVLLRPGDKVPVDGQVIEGETNIDEALVTGESVPVTKRPGDQVIAGSINRSGSVRFRATKVGADTTLAQIVDLVQRAQSSKAPGQRLADRAAQYLVILAVGSGVGAKYNILIKDAATLENVSSINAIVLDKTGTLTEGKPALTDVVTVGSMPEPDLLRLVASAEQGSEHPLAEAIVTGVQERGVSLTDATQFEAIAGHGIRATVDGRTFLIGNRKLMADQGVDASPLEQQAATLAEQGKTPMFVAIDGQAVGLIAVADTIKPTAEEAIQRFKELGIEAVMITGDNARTAAAVAKALDIERFFAEVLPADKARHVKELQAEGKRVGMVGDGVNDAPALAQADIGIAIGAGTDVAIETANVVLMKSDPLDISRAIILSKATVRKMKQNLVWASVYNVLAIPIAAGVLYPSFGIELRPEWSALLMSLSSIIVATNAVLLKRVERELGEPSAGKPSAPLSPAPAT